MKSFAIVTILERKGIYEYLKFNVSCKLMKRICACPLKSMYQYLIFAIL